MSSIHINLSPKGINLLAFKSTPFDIPAELLPMYAALLVGDEGGRVCVQLIDNIHVD